jgi:L-ascorbate metabolism protein UlaG (beta-lactamase superfamily)
MSLNGSELTWCGHSAFSLKTAQGKVVLIDPFLSGNPSCPDRLKKPGQVDLILVTHAHGDHLGDTVEIGRRHQPDVCAIFELASYLESQGLKNVHGYSKGGTVEVQGVKVTMVNAFHSSGLETTDGDFTYAGESAGFVIDLGGARVYHAGDTCVFGDMALIADLYAPDVACLPIGDHFTMGPREAALAVSLLKVKTVVPMHWGTFPVLTGTPDALRRELAGQPDVQVVDLKPGDTLR